MEAANVEEFRLEFHESVEDSERELGDSVSSACGRCEDAILVGLSARGRFKDEIAVALSARGRFEDGVVVHGSVTEIMASRTSLLISNKRFSPHGY